MTTGDQSASETETTSADASTDPQSDANARPDVNAPPSPPKSAAGIEAADIAAGATEAGATAEPAKEKSVGAGPLAQVVRGEGPLAGRTKASKNTQEPKSSGAAKGLGIAKPSSPTVSPEDLAKHAAGKAGGKPKPKNKHPRPRLGGERATEKKAETAGQSAAGFSSGSDAADQAPRPRTPSKVAVPNLRSGLSDDLQAELDAELAAADVEGLLSGPAGMADRKEPLSEGARVAGQVLKVDTESVFVALGGPDEGMVPFEQFTEEPVVGTQIEVVVRGFASADGLYLCSLPGGAIDVSDWEDIEEGAVVEATVTGANSGGLECKVGGVRGFIPISQIADYRVEDTSEFVDQKFLCVVNEANARRGNLVLSRRAVLEREREEKRKEQLEKIEPGDTMEGIVRSVKDFGAFVDLGGLDGLIHISKLSWDRVTHPSEVLEIGQKVQVQIEKVDKETGKIGLSYRDLQENPWDTAEAEFAVGNVYKATVTRIANFGCFAKLAPGVEGLVHISEVAAHRVSRVDAFVSEGQEVEVKVLSFDRDSQKISLSIKQANAPAIDTTAKTVDEDDEPQRDVAVQPMHSGPLKGGNNTASGGEKFGLRW